MAWNGSESKAAARVPTKPVKAPPSKWRGLVALVIVVAAGGLAAWWFTRPAGKDDLSDGVEKPSRIVEVKPQVVTNAAEVAKAEPEPEKPDPNARPTRPGQKLNGYVMLANGRLHKVRGEVVTTQEGNKGAYAIFDYPSENIIAGILSLEPGANLVGTRYYNGRFTENFLKSIRTPIIVKEDDPDDVKALKRAVNEAKIELKLAHDRGEDIEEIMTKAREDAQKLARVKQNMKREVLASLREAESLADAEDVLSAANKILESQGIAPLDNVPMNKIKMKFQAEIEARNAKTHQDKGTEEVQE